MHQACGPPPRLVNVVLFRENDPHERLMCNELRRLSCAQQVRQLFVAMNPAVDGPRLVGDILYIPGAESTPGVLHKAVEAMRYCLQHIPFDVLIRSKASTVIDFTAIACPVAGAAAAEPLAAAEPEPFAAAEPEPFAAEPEPFAAAEPEPFAAEPEPFAAAEPEPFAAAEGLLQMFASGTDIVLSRPAVEYLVLHAADLRTVDAPRWGDDAPGAAASRGQPESVYVLRMRKIVDRLVAA